MVQCTVPRSEENCIKWNSPSKTALDRTLKSQRLRLAASLPKPHTFLATVNQTKSFADTVKEPLSSVFCRLFKGNRQTSG